MRECRSMKVCKYRGTEIRECRVMKVCEHRGTETQRGK